MKSILICCESLATGGVGTYTLGLGVTFRQRGWSVAGLVSTFRGEQFSEMATIVDDLEDLSGLTLGFGKAKIAAAAIEHLSPDVLLLNHCPLAHYALPLINSKIKPVSIVHADVPLYYRTAVRFPERIFRWVCPSPRLGAGIGTYLPRSHRGRVAVIPHGTDAGLPEGMKERPRIDLEPRVVFAGHLGTNKGAQLLPEIFEEAGKAIAQLQFEVLGKGDLEPHLRAEFERRGLRVAMKGHVDKKEVHRSLASAHILLLPTEGEGFGLVIAEAMHNGAVPVVANLEGATDEIVRSGENGLLVDRGDTRGYARAIVGLIQNPTAWAAMSRAAVAVARERFSLEIMAERYEALFAEPDDRPPKKDPGPVAWRAKSLREHFRNRWRRS